MKSSLCAIVLTCWGAFGQPSADIPATVDRATRAEVADKFAQLLADEYAYPEVGAKMAAAIRAHLWGGDYDGLSSPTDFANTLQTDARAVSHDLHLRVGFGGRQMQMRQGPPAPEQRSGGISVLQILEGNIGYLALDIQVRQDEPAKAAIAGAFAFLHNTDALILDLRGNPGGNGGAELFLSYLSEGAPFLAGSVHWRRENRVQEFRTSDLGDKSYGAGKPVFVLTSPTTFSAAEGLAYEIQAFKRGVIVGETTGGGANPSGGAGLPPLGHGFSVNIPMGYVLNPVTGSNWENVGVKPDVAVPAAEAFGKAWSLAADRLRRSESDPQRQAVLGVLAVARLSGPPGIPGAQLAGTYAAGSAQVTVAEKSGKLYLGDVPLESEGGDRYRPAVFSAGFSLTFVFNAGRLQMLRADPRGSSVLEKTPVPR